MSNAKFSLAVAMEMNFRIVRDLDRPLSSFAFHSMNSDPSLQKMCLKIHIHTQKKRIKSKEIERAWADLSKNQKRKTCLP